MGQVTIYLDDAHEQRLRKAAESAGVPVSRWLAALVEQHTRTEWPAEVREAVGSWPDAPDADTLRSSLGQDVPREPL
ncbi:MAG: CopG family transcriptional regulator [Spirochaetaceae bacterium]|nr:MAG: CopG family transcriptional regulator [Spirochaetaceae bacterium]